jgi:hypothetical protein
MLRPFFLPSFSNNPLNFLPPFPPFPPSPPPTSSSKRRQIQKEKKKKKKCWLPFYIFLWGKFWRSFLLKISTLWLGSNLKIQKEKKHVNAL